VAVVVAGVLVLSRRLLHDRCLGGVGLQPHAASRTPG
jgi:hypothetical protein